MATEEELAHTATAPAVGDRTIASRLGRYQLGRELGRGGMGIVYAARDPDLERDVAIKILRAAPSPDARARLLREAQAMAKLSHPNAITVFEVGSDGDTDYVVMELIDGDTLASWLASRPTRDAIVAAFVAAGRGLAAAHAAGIVHRDFKPHNVLRRRDGRVVVTDFGLAHGDASDRATSAMTEHTATGALLGTPAYMAPEQWTGGAVTPASDQFAFCVALWEALAGSRPFRGTTLDELKAAALAGPDRLVARALPRPLRALVRRGLAVDPARRWPSLEALLARLDRTRQRRRRVLASAAVVVLAGGLTAGFVLVPRGAAVGCEPPAIEPALVAARATAERATIARELDLWSASRARACAAPANVRAAQLACLDGVIARLDDLARVTTPLDGDTRAVELVEATTCERDHAPHLEAPISPQLHDAFAALRTAISGGTVAEVPGNATGCARAVWLLARIHDLQGRWNPLATSAAMLTAADELASLIESCRDDVIDAYAAITLADGDDPATVARAERAIAGFPSELAPLGADELHAELAARGGRVDEALAILARAQDAHRERGRTRMLLADVVEDAEIRLARGREDDLLKVFAREFRWRHEAIAVAPQLGGKLANLAAKALWRLGDVARADDAAMAGFAPRARALPDAVEARWPARDGDGVVVDERGVVQPTARVATGLVAMGDSAQPLSPVFGIVSAVEVAADGTFVVHGVRGVIAAWRGTQRSDVVPIAPHLRLVLHDTSRIEGTVALGNTPPGRALVLVVDDPPRPGVHMLVAPVREGGAFVIDGVARGKYGIVARQVDELAYGADELAPIVVDAPLVRGVALALARRAPLQVIARAADLTPPERAFVVVFRGRYAGARARIADVIKQLGSPQSEHIATPAPRATGARQLEPDDLVAELSSPAAGELTICAAGLSKKLVASGASIGALGKIMLDLDFGCAVAAPTDLTVHVDVPTIRRLRP